MGTGGEIKRTENMGKVQPDTVDTIRLDVDEIIDHIHLVGDLQGIKAITLKTNKLNVMTT